MIMALMVSCIACGEKPEITVNNSTVSIEIGEKLQIDASVTLDKTLTYASSNSSVVTVSSTGLLTGVKAGSATITISTKGAESKTVNVTVEEAPTPVITVKESSVTVYIGATLALDASVTEGATLSYVSSNTAAATIDSNGVITGVAEGNSIITISAEGAQSVNVNVMVEYDLSDQIEVTSTVNTLAIGEKTTLEFTNKYPDDSVSFKSSDRAIATVTSKGVVTAKKAGQVTITLVSGYSAYECNYEMTITDSTAPEFVLDGVTLDDNTNWNETFDALKGITAKDDGDGDVTANITYESNVDVKTRGQYEVKYSVKDSSGNVATLTRKITVDWEYSVQFIGHGGCYYSVFNTLQGFTYALKDLHYTCIECDLAQTSDGVFVLCHDATFGGVTVATTSYADLSKVVATSTRNSGFPKQYGTIPGNGTYSSNICTLKEYLAVAKEYDATCVIELKDSNGITNGSQTRMPALMAEIAEMDMLDHVIFLGSNYNCLIWVKQNGYSYIPCQYLVNSIESDTYLDRCKTYGLDISFNATGTDSNGSLYANGENWIAKYKEIGCKVSCWTFTQYCDYKDVQSWIDKGVDFVTCDWVEPEKLDLPKSSTSKKTYNVTFLNEDGSTLKVAKVQEGRAAATPTNPVKEGYTFVGWDKDISKVTSNMTVSPLFEITTYTISYDTNLIKATESSWASKEEFVSDFYTDLLAWLGDHYTEYSNIKYDNGTYTITTQNTSYPTATFSDVTSLRALGVYEFEAGLSSMMYKQIEGTNSADYIPVTDSHYFLNCEPYRTKYQGMNAYLLNAMNTSYTSYSTVYKPASSNRVQIFFRFHQWCKGTNIAAFDKYPVKYIVESGDTSAITLPSDHVTYTCLDSFTLSNPTLASGSTLKFKEWNTKADGTGETVSEIKAGTTGNLILYAIWEE